MNVSSSASRHILFIVSELGSLFPTAPAKQPHSKVGVISHFYYFFSFPQLSVQIVSEYLRTLLMKPVCFVSLPREAVVDFYAPTKLNSVITVIIINTKKQTKKNQIVFVRGESFSKVYFFHSPIKVGGKYQVCLGLGGIIDPTVDEQESKFRTVYQSLCEL